jgi:hypothetical protein
LAGGTATCLRVSKDVNELSARESNAAAERAGDEQLDI